MYYIKTQGFNFQIYQPSQYRLYYFEEQDSSVSFITNDSHKFDLQIGRPNREYYYIIRAFLVAFAV